MHDCRLNGAATRKALQWRLTTQLWRRLCIYSTSTSNPPPPPSFSPSVPHPPTTDSTQATRTPAHLYTIWFNFPATKYPCLGTQAVSLSYAALYDATIQTRLAWAMLFGFYFMPKSCLTRLCEQGGDVRSIPRLIPVRGLHSEERARTPSRPRRTPVPVHAHPVQGLPLGEDNNLIPGYATGMIGERATLELWMIAFPICIRRRYRKH